MTKAEDKKRLVKELKETKSHDSNHGQLDNIFSEGS